MIVREGAHGLRMAGVAEEAGVSKALVHYYFATRQELLRSAFAFSVERWHAAVDAALVDVVTGRARVERMLLVSVEPDLPFSEQRVLWNEVWSSLRSDDELRPLVERSYRASIDRLVNLIEEGRADGSIPAAVDCDGGRLAPLGGRRRPRLPALPRSDRPRAGGRATRKRDRPGARRLDVTPGPGARTRRASAGRCSVTGVPSS